MIRFALVCQDGHSFESWFKSGSSFDALAAGGLVDCPACGSTKVTKAIMAPALGRSVRPGEAPSEPKPPQQEGAPASASVPAVAPAADATAPVAFASEGDRAMRAMLRAMRAHLVANADNVGRGFADEARKMHHGEIEHRSIYGEASPDEALALRDEGIEVHALPVLPDDRN